MGKTIRTNDPQSKKYKKRHRKTTSDATREQEYSKKIYKKGYATRKWPTDSERNKGQKI
jgi:hypothetical protein